MRYPPRAAAVSNSTLHFSAMAFALLCLLVAGQQTAMAARLKTVSDWPAISATPARGLADAYDVEVSGKYPPGTEFVWSVEAESKGTVISYPTLKIQPVTTQRQSLEVRLFDSGVVNVQVLLTVPGERVVGVAARLALGLKDRKPKPQLAALYALPEVGDEVLVNMSSSPGAGRLTYSTYFGDESDKIAGVLVSHSYPKDGNYRITSTAVNSRNISADVFLDISVLKLIPLVNPCTLVDPVNYAYQCSNSQHHAVCMNFLRESPGDYACWDLSNPLNDAEKLASGAPNVLQGCSQYPELSTGGWRCFTDRDLSQCRRYLVGHQHLSSSDIRQCMLEDQPDKLNGTQAVELDWTAGAGFTREVEGNAQLAFNNPGPGPQTHQCNEQIANHFGGTCSRECDQAYFTVMMEPGAPDLPLIQGLSCDAVFVVGTISGLGDSHLRAEAACEAIASTSIPGGQHDYTTTTWMTVTGHFLWTDPATGGNANNRWYTNTTQDYPVTPVTVAVPTSVSCSY